MMLPITEFNFVVAGLATFAATVGYACTRRLSSSFAVSSSDRGRDSRQNDSAKHESRATEEKSPMMTEQQAAASGVQMCQEAAETVGMDLIPTSMSKENLKRKIPHDGFEEPEKPVKTQDLAQTYSSTPPQNLAHIYSPNKRFKTPPSEDESVKQTSRDSRQDNTPAPATTMASDTTTDTGHSVNGQDCQVILTDMVQPQSPAPEPPHSPSVADTPSPLAVPTPSTPIISNMAKPEAKPTTTTPPLSFAPPTPFASSGGFAAFAGSASPFSTATVKSEQTTLKPGRSIWNSAPSDLTSHQNDEAPQKERKVDDTFKPVIYKGNALEETKPVASPSTAKHTHLTGEEDEDVEMELKGVKLYVKRGEKPYGEGIVGNLKLLSHRTTLEERLLFRRDPLWKVTMNVRVQPTVRCAFVPEENALKLILKENDESSSADSPQGSDVKQELVIYVFKPGRSCSKQDFKDFALILADNAHFRLPMSSPSKSP